MTEKPGRIVVLALLLSGLTACNPKEDNTASLLESLTFHASFDHGVDAEFAKGDPKMYTAITVRPELKTREGLPEEVSSVAGGRFDNALSFNSPDEIKGTRAFYRLPGNFPYEKSDWE